MSDEKYTNGHDQEDIEPDSVPVGKDLRQSSPTYTIDDLAQEDDDLTITGDGVLNHVEVRAAASPRVVQVHPSWKLSTRAMIDKRGTREVYYLLHKRLMPWSESLGAGFGFGSGRRLHQSQGQNFSVGDS